MYLCVFYFVFTFFLIKCAQTLFMNAPLVTKRQQCNRSRHLFFSVVATGCFSGVKKSVLFLCFVNGGLFMSIRLMGGMTQLPTKEARIRTWPLCFCLGSSSSSSKGSIYFSVVDEITTPKSGRRFSRVFSS